MIEPEFTGVGISEMPLEIAEWLNARGLVAIKAERLHAYSAYKSVYDTPHYLVNPDSDYNRAQQAGYREREAIDAVIDLARHSVAIVPADNGNAVRAKLMIVKHASLIGRT